jgi:hypothetical protein
MIKLKKGDKTTIKSTIDGSYLYYTGVKSSMNYDGLPLVFLARDINNKLTFSQFSQQFLAEQGYII